jgi:hypothetical protein
MTLALFTIALPHDPASFFALAVTAGIGVLVFVAGRNGNGKNGGGDDHRP